MITETKRFVISENRWVSTLRGLSTDTKPSGKINGSTFKEIDTGKVYKYDEDNDTWHLQP